MIIGGAAGADGILCRMQQALLLHMSQQRLHEGCLRHVKAPVDDAPGRQCIRGTCRVRSRPQPAQPDGPPDPQSG
jgi:hypothetical protein